MDTKRETFEERKERYKEKLANLTMMSDILARNVLKDKAACEYVLGILMEDKTISVIENTVQADYRNLHGRSVILDCVARDGRGKVFNVEVQQEDEGAHPKRARYHLGAMDMNVLNPGEFFDKLPETYVIFVTQNDVLGYGLPVAHIDRIVRENGKAFADEAHFIYADSSKQDDTEIGRLMHDFRCKDAREMQEGALADRVKALKETEKGVEYMCKEMEEIRAEGITEGKKEIVYSLAERKMSIEEIAQIAKVSIDTVKEWLSGASLTAR